MNVACLLFFIVDLDDVDDDNEMLMMRQMSAKCCDYFGDYENGFIRIVD